MADAKRAKRRLGDFEILRELGRGGMGLVYEARQLSLNRKVALKILAGSLGITPSAVVRFRREAEAAAKLHHTNIVPVYGIGEEDGTHFYAMELIEGPSLNHVIAHMRRTPSDDLPLPTGNGEGTSAVEIPEWVGETLTYNAAQPHAAAERARAEGAMAKRSAAMPKRNKPKKHEPSAAESTTGLKSGGNYFDTIARMIAEVADGLDYAHNHGVIHRDMKPSNLMLSPDGRVSINDFGLARMLEQPGMTMTGEFMGSPLYMSPEQIVAGRMPLDHRTDIYSLGATLYELLTLQPPFPGETRDRIIAQIMTKEPASPRKVNKRIPLDLETICLKALEKDPDRRYATAGAFADDLRRYVNRHAISARRTGLAGRAIKWARRHRATAAALAFALVMGLMAAGVSYSAYRQRETARIKQGEDMLDLALTDAFTGRIDAMEEHLGQAEVLDVDPGRLRLLRSWAAIVRTEHKEALRHAQFADAQLPDSLAAKAILWLAYIVNDRLDKALALTPTIIAMAPAEDEDYFYGAIVMRSWWPERAREWLETLSTRKPLPAIHGLLGEIRLRELVDTYNPSDIEATLAHLGAAKTQMPDDNGGATVGLAYARLVAADIHKVLGNDLEFRRYLELARKDAKTLLDEHAEYGWSHSFNGRFAIYEGRWADAIDHIRWALEKRSIGYEYSYRIELVQLAYREDSRTARTELDALPDEFKVTGAWVFARACVAAELEGVDAAAKFYHDWLEKRPPRPESWRELAWGVFRLLGQPEEATKWALDYTDRAGAPIVPRPCALVLDRYVRGEASGDILLAEATAAGSRGLYEHFLIGLEHLSVGDRPGAIREFEKIEHAGNFAFAGFARWGILFLERLREDPTWPPWIPMKPAPTTQP